MRHTSSAAAAVVCSSHVLGAALGPLVAALPSQQNQPTSPQGIEIPRFNPALGSLRCVEIVAATTWSLSGTVTVFRAGTTAAGSAFTCLTGTVAIGHFDGTGFVTHAGASGPCQLVGGSLPAGGPNFATFSFSITGESTSATLITGPTTMAMYTGVGTGNLYCPRSWAVQPGGSGSPGYAMTLPSNPQRTADARFDIRFFYTPAQPCPGDANSDGVVDFQDLNGALATYTQSGPCALGDVNNDGVVDFLDLNEILAFYGQACAVDAPRAAVTPPPPASTR